VSDFWFIVRAGTRRWFSLTLAAIGAVGYVAVENWPAAIWAVVAFIGFFNEGIMQTRIDMRDGDIRWLK